VYNVFTTQNTHSEQQQHFTSEPNHLNTFRKATSSVTTAVNWPTDFRFR